MTLWPQADHSFFLIYSMTAVVVAYLVYIALADYTHLRISNRSVILGLILYLSWAVTVGAASPWTDAIAAGLLFALGFSFWLFRLAGAGDAKFMLVCGALVGLAHLMQFALFLALISIAFYVMIKVASRPIFYPLVTMTRVGEFLESGKVPYGLSLASATLAVFLIRMSQYLAGI